MFLNFSRLNTVQIIMKKNTIYNNVFLSFCFFLIKVKLLDLSSAMGPLKPLWSKCWSQEQKKGKVSDIQPVWFQIMFGHLYFLYSLNNVFINFPSYNSVYKETVVQVYKKIQENKPNILHLYNNTQMYETSLCKCKSEFLILFWLMKQLSNIKEQ